MIDSKAMTRPPLLASRYGTFLILASIVAFSLVACGESSDLRQAGQVPGQGGAAPNKVETNAVDSESSARFRSALLDAAADAGSRTGLELSAGCQRNSNWRSVRIFSSGVAIWGGERQFQLTEVEISDLLQQLVSADFPALPDQYGGSPEPDRMQAKNARTVVCNLRVGFAGVEKEVLQINRGEQSETFARLVNGLLDSCEEPAAAGVGAEDLAQGLEMVASGELDPATFELHFQVMAEGAAPEESVDEFILGVEGLMATVRLRDPVDGYSEPSQLELTGEELSELAWKLADNAPSRFPQNLSAPSYSDLSIRVLKRKMSLVARPYRGIDPKTHGELQQDFDATVELLDALHERVLNEGAISVPKP